MERRGLKLEAAKPHHIELDSFQSVLHQCEGVAMVTVMDLSATGVKAKSSGAGHLRRVKSPINRLSVFLSS